MKKATWYLIAMILFLLGAVFGFIGWVTGSGHWVQWLIPLALFFMALALWAKYREPAT
jgi:hypothetical protein